jgi:Transposase zinc-ribbon domain
MASKPASQVRGLSEAQFREAYGSEAQCRAVVERLRWPKGFVGPLCGGCEGKWLSTRPKVQCRACRHQVSLTAGTIFHATIDSNTVNPVPQGREPMAREGCR